MITITNSPVVDIDLIVSIPIENLTHDEILRLIEAIKPEPTLAPIFITIS